MIPHHGLSRSALQHQKWLWNTRYDEWMQWQADVDTAEMGAYGGIMPNAAAIEPPPPLRRYARASSSPMPPDSEYAAASKKTEMNEKIFPRTGDLTALHDPQVVRLDQTFCNYPLWTIRKVLFVCSMDTAARGVGLSSQDPEKPDTRAEDDQETEAPSGLSKSKSRACLSAIPDNLMLTQRDLTKSDSTIPLLTKLRWEQSWQTRWEVLTALVRMTERAVLARGSTKIPSTVTTPIGLPVVARSLTNVVSESPTTRVPTRFFLAGSERLGEIDGSESDDDADEEEEDYGEIILNPRFSLQKSVPDGRGCGFGRSILHAQVLPLDTRRGVKALRL